MPRYEKSEQFEITFNPKDIPQLEPERNAQLKVKKETAIYTINEMRAESEAEPLDGGQYVYGTMGTTPIATDDSDMYAQGETNYPNEPNKPNETGQGGGGQGSTEQEENPNQVEEKPIEDAEKQKADFRATKEEFIKRLRLQVNKDGTSRFTEDEINELAKEHFGE